MAKKYVKSLEIESRIYFRGSKQFFLVYVNVLLGNKTSTGHVHAINFQKNIPSSHCCDALMHCSSKKQFFVYVCMCTYIYIVIKLYTYVCVCLCVNIYMRIMTSWLFLVQLMPCDCTRGPEKHQSCYWCDLNWDGHAHSNESKASTGRMVC